MKASIRIVAFRSLLLLSCVVTHAANSSAQEQDYPAKPVHIIEPFGLGGGPDLLARALAPKLSELWGQPVTVENHPGAGAHRGPRASREVGGRRLHGAHQHQCSGI